MRKEVFQMDEKKEKKSMKNIVPTTENTCTGIVLIEMVAKMFL